MKITIVGTGGVGGYIGGKILNSNQDHEITFIARGEHLNKIRKNGLKVIEEENEFTVHPHNITDNPKNLESQDLVLFCTKTYDLQESAKIMQNCITKETYVIPLSNGVDHDKELKEILPDANILNGCVYILSNISEPGSIKKYGGVFYLLFGKENMPLENLKKIETIFSSSSLKTKLTSNIKYETWKKYLFISSFATMTSYYKQPIGWIIENKKEEVLELLKEIITVANKKNIPLNEENITNCIKQTQNIPYNSKTSMQIDLEKGKKTEVEALCGYIVKQAKKLNVQVSIMNSFYEALKSFQKTT